MSQACEMVVHSHLVSSLPETVLRVIIYRLWWIIYRLNPISGLNLSILRIDYDTTLVRSKCELLGNRRVNSVSVQFSSVQSLSHVRLFATPWIAARQASLSIANSQTLLKLMSIESVMPSSHLILCRPLLLLPNSLPASGFFQWVNSLHQVAKVLEFQLQHQSFQWTPRTDLL